MKFNLFNLTFLGMFVLLCSFTAPSNHKISVFGEPIKTREFSEPTAARKTLILEIVSTSGKPVEFSAFIRHGADNYFLEKETTPYRLEVEDKDFSGVFHKLTEGGEWQVKAEKFLGEKRLTDVKGNSNVTVVESSESTISSWGM
jgi:hypothetical protein